jgi:hypothetical protein
MTKKIKPNYSMSIVAELAIVIWATVYFVKHI